MSSYKPSTPNSEEEEAKANQSLRKHRAARARRLKAARAAQAAKQESPGAKLSGGWTPIPNADPDPLFPQRFPVEASDSCQRSNGAVQLLRGGYARLWSDGFFVEGEVTLRLGLCYDPYQLSLKTEVVKRDEDSSLLKLSPEGLDLLKKSYRATPKNFRQELAGRTR